jgi:two-component system cell cycle response regulator
LLITVLVLGTLRRRNARLMDALHRQAMADGLTGLPNRRAFTEAISTVDKHVWLALVDADHFKRINDTAGHAAGDETLRALGQLLSRRVRGEDLAARLGGEEFVVVFRDGADPFETADALRREVPEASPRWPHPITVSIGVAGGDAAETDSLLAAADAALYRAKAAGRDRTMLAEQSTIAGWATGTG